MPILFCRLTDENMMSVPVWRIMPSINSGINSLQLQALIRRPTVINNYEKEYFIGDTKYKGIMTKS